MLTDKLRRLFQHSVGDENVEPDNWTTDEVLVKDEQGNIVRLNVPDDEAGDSNVADT